MTPLHVVILAAGQGQRMRSSLPKVLHLLAGRPLLSYVVEAGECARRRAGACGARARRRDRARGDGRRPRRVGGAARAARHRTCGGAGDGRHPRRRDGAGALRPTFRWSNRTTAARHGDAGFGLWHRARHRGGGRPERIRPASCVVRTDRSAASSKRGMRTTSSAASRRSTPGFSPPTPEGCAAGYGARAATTSRASTTSPTSSPVRSRTGCRFAPCPPEAIEEVLGVNDRAQLAALERFQQRRLAEGLMRDGASLADPARVDIRGRVRTGSDVFVDVKRRVRGRGGARRSGDHRAGVRDQGHGDRARHGGPRPMRHRRGAHRRGLPDRPLRPGSARRPDCPAMPTSGTSSRSRTRPSARAPRRAISPTSATAASAATSTWVRASSPATTTAPASTRR